MPGATADNSEIPHIFANGYYTSHKRQHSRRTTTETKDHDHRGASRHDRRVRQREDWSMNGKEADERDTTTLSTTRVGRVKNRFANGEEK